MLFRVLVVLALLAYPFAVYLGLERLGPKPFALVLGLLVALRLFIVGRHTRGRLAVILLILLAGYVGAVWVSGDARFLKAYPVLVNAGLFLVFAGSLHRPPTVIERGLVLAGQEVPARASSYLWWVTFGWSVFFVVNGLIAAWTAWAAPLGVWTLYNGVLAYVLIAALFGIEYCIRIIYRRRVAPGREHDSQGR